MNNGLSYHISDTGDDELNAIAVFHVAVRELDPEAQERVANYLAARFKTVLR